MTTPGDLLRFFRRRLRRVFPRPDLATAADRLASGHDALRREFTTSPLRSAPDTFVLYRIIGNDLPPRHASGQSLTNIRFLLENEPPLPGCEKRWVLNRIVDPAAETALLDLLHAHNQRVLRIPFVASDYARVGLDFSRLPSPDFLASDRFRNLSTDTQSRIRVAVHRLKNIYVMNNNGARNAALYEGRTIAKWVLPFDGNCFFTATAWEKLRADVTARPWLKYFVAPMARVLDNQQLLDPAYTPPALEEPQLIFRADAAESFNPECPYGGRPKVELFWRLGIPGLWDDWDTPFWEQPRPRLSPEARQFGVAGWVARLFSGNARLETDVQRGPGQRGHARREAILTLLARLDSSLGLPSSENPCRE